MEGLRRKHAESRSLVCGKARSTLARTGIHGLRDAWNSASVDVCLQWGLRWTEFATSRSWPRLRMLDAVKAARHAVSTGHSYRPGHRRSDSWFHMYACVLKQYW
jgi:hypothetical protein